MRHPFPWRLMFLLILWLSEMISRAGLPVSEDGAQLAFVQDLRDLTVKIQSDQSLSQQHLAKIRAMEEGSKSVTLAMAQMDSLVKHGQLLNQNEQGPGQTFDANSLQYNGSSLVGGNYQFIDNIMGENGPIAMDRVLPATLVPVSGGLLQLTQQSMTNFTSSSSSNLVSATLGALMGNLAQSGSTTGNAGVAQTLTQWLQGTSSGSSGMLGDGVFLRPYAGVIDDAYQALVVNGTSAQKVQFFADPNLGGNGYNTVLGATGNPNLSMVNMDNVFSAGASQAYQSYLQNNPGGGSNPYQGYAGQLLAELPALINQTPPGTPIVPTGQQITTAQQNSDASNVPANFPSIFSPSLDSDQTAGTSTPFGLIDGDSSSSGQGVIVVTPTAAEAQIYQEKIAASDQKLQTIVGETKTQQQAQQYYQKIVQSLNAIQQQAQGIQQDLNSTAPNSIPELTTLIRDVQGDIEARQRDLTALSLDIEKLQQELQAELQNRAKVVDAEQKEEAAHALPRWRAAMNGN